MPTMERIPISKWKQQTAKSSHTTPSAIAALAITKNDGNDYIAPTVSEPECRSDINYHPAVDDTQRDDSKNASAAACPVTNNTSRSTTNTTNTNRLNDDDEEDSDEEIGAMIYVSSNTASARRVAAEAASAVNINQSSSYESRSEVRKSKREISSDISSSSNSNEMESAPKKKRIFKSFEQRIVDLKAYKEKNGHIKVKKSEDKSLYDFCNHIRNARNNPEKSSMALTDERIASLDTLGFDWRMNSDKSFEQRIADLEAYKEKHGHVNVKKSEDNRSLFDFCYNIRKARNNPEKSNRVLTDDRIASLSALGFDWSMNSTNIKLFEQRIADLKAYKVKHGHINVKLSDDKSLYHFCRDMRHARKHSEKSKTLINEERIASLDALGFGWRWVSVGNKRIYY